MRRDLAGRAVLVAAGVGTALGATAGLASAAPLESDLQQGPSGQNAFDQSLPTDALAGGLPQAPNLSLTDGVTKTQAASPADAGTASPDAIAGLASNGMLSGLGSNQGQAEESSTDASSADASSADASKAADESSTEASKATDESSTDAGKAADESSTEAGSTGSGSTGSPAGSSTGSGYTANYGG